MGDPAALGVVKKVLECWQHPSHSVTVTFSCSVILNMLHIKDG